MTARVKGLNFPDIAQMDPAIGALELLAKRAAKNAGGDPDYMVFYREIKPLVTALVGWHRPPSDGRINHAKVVDFVLQSEQAYDVVYQHLVEVIGQDGDD